MAKRIHIIIADSSAIIRYGMESIIRGITSFVIDIAEVSDVSSLLSLSSKEAPDVLVVNPSSLGLLSLSQLRSDLGNDNLKIIALQSSFTDQSLLQSYDEVLTIFDSVETIKDKICSVIKKDSTADVKKELSQREKEIIVGVAKGLTNKQIADELFLSTHTVIAHRRNIASKLQIHSPSGLTIYAIVNKLVDL